ncbi:MAG TPA: DUF4157 domain-containing protein [Longimicrobium sp.]
MRTHVQAPAPETAFRPVAPARPRVANAPSAAPGDGFAHDFSGVPARAQAKLHVNTPGDAFEQEAERVADMVTRAPARGGGPAGSLSQLAGPPRLSRKPAGAGGGGAASDQLVTGLGTGRPLDPGTRSGFEARFGRDFGGVRVHTDDRAARLAGSIDAQAYTVGRDVVFGAGRYAPGTRGGDRLLAHELAHVVQQGAAQPAGERVVQRQPDGGAPAPAPAPAAPSLAFGQVVHVEVRTMEAEAATHEYPIDVNGFIKMPMLGLVPANGRTTDQLADDIRTRLISGQFFHAPTVNVRLTSKIVAYGALVTGGDLHLRLLSGAGDVEGYSGSYPVRVDGTLNVPGIGSVAARGLRLDAVEADIQKRFRDGFVINGVVHLTRQHLD